MIRLASSDYWLDATATGWWLVWVVREKGRAGAVERRGPFTSPRHVLQQRAVELPDDARQGLAELVEVLDPDAAMGHLPPPGA